MIISRNHLAGLELALDEMHSMLDGSCEARLNRLIADAQNAPEAEPVATSDVIHHVFSRDRNIGWNAPEEEQAWRELFEAWLEKSRCSRPNSPWDIWKASAKALSKAAPQHDAELIELLTRASGILGSQGFSAWDDLAERIDAKLKTLGANQ